MCCSAARAWAGASVEAVGSGVSIGLIRSNATGTYLFVDVLIDPAAAPGMRTLRVKTAAGAADVPFELSAPLPRGGRFQGLTSDDVIYLLMPDRFADGDPSNNDPGRIEGAVRPLEDALLPRRRLPRRDRQAAVPRSRSA